MQSSQLEFLQETSKRLEGNLEISRQNLENMNVKAPVDGALSGFNIEDKAKDSKNPDILSFISGFDEYEKVESKIFKPDKTIPPKLNLFFLFRSFSAS